MVSRLILTFSQWTGVEKALSFLVSCIKRRLRRWSVAADKELLMFVENYGISFNRSAAFPSKSTWFAINFNRSSIGALLKSMDPLTEV